MADPITPQEFGLSDAELKTVALIHLHWALADSMLGAAIQLIHKLDTPAAQALAHSPDERAKLRILASATKTCEIPTEGLKAIKELEHCYKQFKRRRNLYAHGLMLTGGDGSRRMTSLRGEDEGPSLLPLRYEQPKYVAIAAARLCAALLPSPPAPPAWPSRPGERPGPQ